ncbi:MAG: DHHA1 domain-containing protein, partial [Clostridia bacterium]|nr:DHHA1 domain-containing protein [Clostridia bacterium]
DGFTVEHIRIEGETVIHELADFKAVAGDEICGKIDLKKRISDMQQHTGEHILSGTAHRLFGSENVGFHLGEDVVTVDLNTPLSKQQVEQLESEANKAVRENRKVIISFPSDEELKRLDYRSKKEIDGQIRIVTIEGVDCCACCAPHLNMTGEAGIIRITNAESHRGGTRLSVLCGERAIDDIQKKLAENRKVGALLCVKELETASAVERLMREKANIEYENKKLTLEILKYKAESYTAQDRIIAFEDCTDTNILREFMNCLALKAHSLAAVFGKENGKITKYVVFTPGKDISPVCKALNAAFSGRGGGRGEMAQGSISGDEKAVEEFMQCIDLPEEK